MPDAYENPKKLQEYVYYMLYCTQSIYMLCVLYAYGYRGGEIWHQLQHRGFKEDVDEQGRPRLSIDQAISEKNYQHTGPSSTCRRIETITDDPEAEVYMYSTLKMYIHKQAGPETSCISGEAKNSFSTHQGPRRALVCQRANRSPNDRQDHAGHLQKSWHLKTLHEPLCSSHTRDEHAEDGVPSASDPVSAPPQISRDTELVHRIPDVRGADRRNPHHQRAAERHAVPHNSRRWCPTRGLRARGVDLACSRSGSGSIAAGQIICGN